VISKRLAAALAGTAVALGIVASSAPSQSTDAEIQLVTAGPGMLTISPAVDEPKATCKVDAQQYEDSSACIQQYEPGTRVTVDAVPDKGHSFVGWSDFACRNSSTRCALTLAEGTRYLTARFSPVTLRIYVGENSPFGLISVKPKPRTACALNDGDPCEYPWGTTVTLSREREKPGFFWIGACDGSEEGTLDEDVCRLRLQSNEVVGAGYQEAGEIPPPLGSGLVVVVGGSGRGKVTGSVINGTQTLDCGTICSIPGLSRYDQVRLTATALGGSRFYRWNNLSRLRTQIVPLSSTTRMQAVFLKK
jgi:hypothetical protein